MEGSRLSPSRCGEDVTRAAVFQWQRGGWHWARGANVTTATAEHQRSENKGVKGTVVAMLKIPGLCQDECTCHNAET